MPAAGRLRYLERTPPPSARARGVLVLLHAFPLNARMWERQLALADDGWRVVAPHLRGFDGGGGLSMGGYVAFAILRHAARYVQGLVLADTRSQADTAEGREGRRRMLQLVQEKGAAAVADEMIPKLLGETTRRERPDVVERARALILSNSTDAIAGAIRALMTRPDSTPLLNTIHVPTLVIVGAEDTVTPPSAAHELHGAIAGSELVQIPTAGHLTNLEQPELFDGALAHFLSHRV